jgi:hypothetical protein
MEDSALTELRRKTPMGGRVVVEFPGLVPFDRLHEIGWGVLGIPKGEATLPLNGVSVVLVAAPFGRFAFRPDYAASLAAISYSGALNYVSRTLMEDPDCALAWSEGARYALAANKLSQATTYVISALKRDSWEPGALEISKKLGIKNPSEQATARERLEAWVKRYRSKMVGPILDIGSDHAMRSYLDEQALRMTLDISPSRKPDILANIENLSEVSDGSFGTILCMEVLEHVRQPGQALQEIFRATRPEGRLFVSSSCLNPFQPSPQDYRRFTMSGLMAEVTDAGWVIEESGGIPLAAGIQPLLVEAMTRLFGGRCPAPDSLGFSSWIVVARKSKNSS